MGTRTTFARMSRALVIFVLALARQGAVAAADCASDSEGVVLQYLTTIGGGNISTGSPKACDFITTDYDFNWGGDKNLIPIGGSYTGCAGLTNFFSTVFARVKEFTFSSDYNPPYGGLRVVGSRCPGMGTGTNTSTVVMAWQELSVNIATGKNINKATNVVVYTLDTTTLPYKIKQGDVWINSNVYATAFCKGQVACSDSGAAATGGNSCPSNVDQDVYFGLTVAILVFTLVAICCVFLKAGSGSSSNNSEDGVGMVVAQVHT